MGKDLKGREIGEGLRQKKNGVYLARFRSVTGKRVEKTFHKVSEAKNWLLKTKYEDKINNTISCDMLFDDWFDKWLNEIKGDSLKYKTKSSYEGRYRMHMKPVIGNMRLDNIKPYHCQKVINHAEKNEETSGTINILRNVMHQCFDSAIENGLIMTNPVTKSVKVVKDKPKEKNILTKEQQREFDLYSFSSAYYYEYSFILETGLRSGELRGLKWKDIDWEQRTISINRTIFYNDKEKKFETNTPKSTASIRKIPLTKKAYEILEKKKKDYSSLPKTRYVKENFVFVNRKGNISYNKTFNDSLKYITNKMGIESLSMHSLRHTFATRCIEAGIRPKTLQAILGHSNINLTMNLYVHTTTDEIKLEMDKLSELWA